MTGAGRIALHGGGEFQPGDEAFLDAVLAAAPVGPDGSIRVVIVPTAAARGRPDLAGAHGVDAVERVARASGRPVRAAVVELTDRAAANDPHVAARLAAADVVHLPGGDPDLLPTVMPGTAAWQAILTVLAEGGVLAGASAGAMALADRCWTPAGIVAGLGLVPHLLVVPHADARGWVGLRTRFAGERPAGVGVLGLAEQTGVLGRPGEPWAVVGPGEVRWLAPDEPNEAPPRIGLAGDRLVLT